MTADYSKAWGFDQLMAIAAFRYCMGRQSYIAGACVDWIIENWDNFDAGTRDCIMRETEDEFIRDDKMRALAPDENFALPLGMSRDRNQWEKIRWLWRVKE